MTPPAPAAEPLRCLCGCRMRRSNAYPGVWYHDGENCFLRYAELDDDDEIAAWNRLVSRAARVPAAEPWRVVEGEPHLVCPCGGTAVVGTMTPSEVRPGDYPDYPIYAISCVACGASQQPQRKIEYARREWGRLRAPAAPEVEAAMVGRLVSAATDLVRAIEADKAQDGVAYDAFREVLAPFTLAPAAPSAAPAPRPGA